MKVGFAKKIEDEQPLQEEIAQQQEIQQQGLPANEEEYVTYFIFFVII